MNTAPCIETYFHQVRSYEYFKYLHIGLLSEIKRKTRCGDSERGRIRKRTRVTPFFDEFTLVSQGAERKEIKINIIRVSGKRNHRNNRRNGG
jgi:hypothetical protein